MGSLFVLMLLATVTHQSTGLNSTLYSNLSTMEREVQKKIVEHHNSIRRSVIPMASNMLKVEWSNKASSNAQKWANLCNVRNSGISSRSIDGTSCGENMFGSSIPVSWDDVILAWELEKNNFIYGVGAISENLTLLAYTQMIWYSTYKIGCGFAQCPNNVYQFLYTCQYCPGGNDINSITTPYKKGGRCADCLHSCENGLCTNPCHYVDEYSNCQMMKDELTCDFTYVKHHCKASCKCTSEIH